MCGSRSMPIGARSRACDRSRCCARMASPTARASRWPHQLRRRSKTTWCRARGLVQLLRNRDMAGYRRRRCHRMRVHPMPRRRRPMRHMPCSRRRLLSRHRTRGLQTRPLSLAQRRPSRASAHRSRVRARTLQRQPQSRPRQVRRQVRHQARLQLRRHPLPRLLRSKCRKRRLRQSARARARQPLRQRPLQQFPLQQLLLPPRLQLLPQLPTRRRLLAARRRRQLPRRQLPKPSRVRQRRWFRSRRSNSQNDPQQSTQQSI
jgi:hypothetical protein